MKYQASVYTTQNKLKKKHFYGVMVVLGIWDKGVCFCFFNSNVS